MSDVTPQRTTAPLVTVDLEKLGEHLQHLAARARHFRELGSIPHCPDYQAWREEEQRELLPWIAALAETAQEFALGMREELQLTGPATPADAWRLFEALRTTLAGHGVTLRIGRNGDGQPRRADWMKQGGYLYLSASLVKIILPLDGRDAEELPRLLGAALVPWGRPVDGYADPDLYRLYRATNQLVGEAFAEAWWGGEPW